MTSIDAQDDSIALLLEGPPESCVIASRPPQTSSCCRQAELTNRGLLGADQDTLAHEEGSRDTLTWGHHPEDNGFREASRLEDGLNGWQVIQSKLLRAVTIVEENIRTGCESGGRSKLLKAHPPEQIEDDDIGRSKVEGEEADKHETSASKLHSENELFDVLMELGEVIQSTEAAHVACIERCIRDVTEARENCAAAGRDAIYAGTSAIYADSSTISGGAADITVAENALKRAFSQAMEEEAKRIAELEELDGRRRREVEEARKEKAGVRGMDGVWARLQEQEKQVEVMEQERRKLERALTKKTEEKRELEQRLERITETELREQDVRVAAAEREVEEGRRLVAAKESEVREYMAREGEKAAEMGGVLADIMEAA
eukprot:70259-Rhodomonas_salina.1